MNALTGLAMLSNSASSSSDILYLSGFSAPDPVLFMEAGGTRYLVVSPMEKGRAEKQSKSGTVVLAPGDLGLKGKRAAKREEQLAALMQRAHMKRIAVPPDFPAGLLLALEKKGVRVSVMRNPPCLGRKTKTAEEVSLLRSCQRAAVRSMDAAVSLLASAQIDRRGRLAENGRLLTSERVRQHIHAVLIAMDFVPGETIVAGGGQSADPHERGHGPLHAGQPIIIDIFPRCERTGYWGDITRTVCRGVAPANLRKLYRAVKQSQRAALEAVKPGVCADEIHARAKAVLLDNGFATKELEGTPCGFIHGTGHGVGLDIHEFPRIGTSGEFIEPGNVVTIEPGLYYPGVGGVRIEDTIEVTQTGWRYLARFEKKLELL